MARFSVDLIVENNHDVHMAAAGILPPKKIRKVTVRGIVDSGAHYLVLPGPVVSQLGLPKDGKITVHYADRRSARRPLVEEARVELLGRHGVFRAIVEPGRTTALIGAIVLEDLDLLVDCTNQKLIPRDPAGMTAEVE